MNIKNLLTASSMVLALSAFMATSAWAETAEEPAAETVAVECLPQADFDAMSDEEKDKVELPVCAETEAAPEVSTEKE